MAFTSPYRTIGRGAFSDDSSVSRQRHEATPGSSSTSYFATPRVKTDGGRRQLQRHDATRSRFTSGRSASTAHRKPQQTVVVKSPLRLHIGEQNRSSLKLANTT